MNIYDFVENFLHETMNIIQPQAEEIKNFNVPNAVILCAQILKEAARFKLYDVDALWQEINKLKILESVALKTASELPFNAFSIYTPNGIIFYMRGDPLQKQKDVLWTCCGVVKSQNDETVFCGPYGYLNNGEVRIYFLRNNQSEEKMQVGANKFLRDACALLVTIDAFKSSIATVNTDKKLQVKRAKNGKFPNWRYYVLTLDKTAISKIPKQQRYKIIGRQSPCTHDRVGYWKTMKSGLRVHVKETTVALKNIKIKGIIEKDYEVIVQ
jgi:hypothetical protein